MGKHSKLIFGAVIFISLLISRPSRIEAASIDELKSVWYDTRYYPIYQGGSEWQKHSMEETLEANNPPYDLLLSMNSEELAGLLFEYPSISQITTYYGTDGEYDYEQFYTFLESESDIFYELLRREDGIRSILLMYQKSGIDSEWFTKEVYNTSTKEENRWYSEVFGSQFIHLYAKVFTEDETLLARQIIMEKNRVYVESTKAYPEYFDTSDIVYYKGNVAGQARTIYIDTEKTKEKEAKLNDAVASIQTEDDVNDEDIIIESERTQDTQWSFKPYGIIIGIMFALIISFAVLIIGKRRW